MKKKGVHLTISKKINLLLQASYKYCKILCKDFVLKTKTDAVHYSYDIHGNVKTLIQENPSLAGISQDVKRLDYEYDLVSGNVNRASYQNGEVDAFYHKYEYDADNRISNVYTSKDNVIWDQDAKYFYYPTGPLARTELGDKQVQAMDYAYTIQGWTKGVNSNTLDATRDIGKDGEESSTNLNRHFGRDAFGYSLNYFTNDYTPIGTITDNFIASTASATYLSTDAPGLYNGNISSMVTTISNPSTNAALPQLTAYKYDQLNRIKQMKAYRDINSSSNTWGSGSTYDGSYEEHYTYNANGSILNLTRNGLASVASGAMDSLTYKYETVANGYTRNTNKLRYILDAKSSGNYTDDLDNQSTDNYDYDEIGNMIKDDFECIQNIEWTVFGKVKSVTRTPSCTTEGTAMPDLGFNYNADRNLVEKIVKPAATLGDASTWIHTYYVRDASGNIMATYEKENTDFTLTEQQIYGSKHIGTAKRDLDMSTSPSTDEFSRTLGKKQFFLSDHRGNNNVTVLDRKKPVESISTPGTVAYYDASITRAVDFFPFGREENGRIFNENESEFGYNGKPNIKEWSARLGSPQNFGARIKYDVFFISPDPARSGWSFETPYSFAGNIPIWAIDKDGEKIYFVGSAISNEALQAAYNTLVQTPSGRELLLKYETSNTHDIYIQLNNFIPSDGAIAVANNNIGTNNFPNGKINLSFDNYKDPKETEAEMKGFQGLDVSRSKGAVSLISLNSKHWDAANPTIGKYELAEALYHEIWAHIFAGAGSGDRQHEIYGKTYSGFYTETYHPLPIDYDKVNTITGQPIREYDHDIVPNFSPAFKIMQELLNVKQGDGGTLNKEEKKILKSSTPKSKSDNKGDNKPTESHQNVRHL